MEFDESKVYTLVNADKVRAGSRGYFADNLRDLKYIVEHDCSEEYGEITEIKNNSYATRFKIENYLFMLFYLVEEPKIEDSKIEKKPLSLNEIAKLSYKTRKKRKAINSHVLNKKFTKFKKRLAFDLADIICSCASIAEREHIDLDKTVADYLEEIEEK